MKSIRFGFCNLVINHCLAVCKEHWTVSVLFFKQDYTCRPQHLPQGCTPVLTKAWHADSILSVSNKNDKDACRCVRFFDEKLLGGLQLINSVLIIFCFGFHWVQCGGDLQAVILPPGSSKKIYVNVFFVYLPDCKIMTQFYQPSKI